MEGMKAERVKQTRTLCLLGPRGRGRLRGMTSDTATVSDQRRARVTDRPRRRYRRHVGRDLRVSTKVGESAYRRADARAGQAGLALGTWMVLLAEDVAAGRPVVGEDLFDAVGAARVRVARIGSAVNAMAATENGGGLVADGELAAVLESLGARAAAASEAVLAVAAVFATTPAPVGDGVASWDPAVGRRSQAEVGRGRQISAQMTRGERDRLTAAAAVEGLSVGAWLGLLLEDPAAIRPLRGEVWGAVFALRKALRRVGTNLAQIEAARAGRQVPAPAGVGEARAQIDAAIRVCLDAQATISGQPGTGGAS